MNQQLNSMKNPAVTDFSWPGDSPFTPPVRASGTGNYPVFASGSSRLGDFKTLLQEFLSTLISTVNAKAGIVRISPPPHGETPQIIGSIGFPSELFEVEKTINVDCETFGKAAVKRGFYSANFTACKTRHDCLNVGCQLRSIIAASLESPHSPENKIGVLTLFFDSPQESSGHTLKTVQAFTSLLGALVENYRLNCETKRAELIAERQSLGNEIHDTLAQTLVYTRMRTGLLLESIRSGNELMTAKCARDIDEALEMCQKTTRELITDFRCHMDPSGLPSALQTLAKQFSLRSNIALEYVNRVARLELPLEYEIQAYHIVQEALANVATHSGASHARLTVDFTSGYYVFTVRDNGGGGCTFTPVEGHYGMMIMRERAQRIGGEIKLNSSKGLGTEVQLYFPEPGSNWRAVNE